jgi:hypothetical protein
MEYSLDADWMAIKPRDPLNSRSSRLDRALLGEFLRPAYAAGRASLDQIATFAAGVEGGIFRSMPLSIVQILLPDAGARMDNNDWEMLRFYGMFSLAKRKVLANGEPLPITGLTEKQKELLVAKTYSDFTQMEVSGTNKFPPGTTARMYYYGGVLSLTPESLPNGIPSDAYIQANFESSEIIMTGSSGLGPSEIHGRITDAQDYAYQRLLQSRPEVFGSQPTNAREVIDKVRYGTRITMDLAVHYNPILSLHSKLSDTNLGAPWLTFEQLPPAFRDEVNKQAAMLEDFYRKQKTGKAGGTGTPPPRGA